MVNHFSMLREASASTARQARAAAPQAIADRPEPLAPAAALVAPPSADLGREPDRAASACPDGMVLVEGEYCPFVGHRCLRPLDGGSDRCAEYATETICEGKLEHKRVCVDRYEYPNLEGVKPAVMVDFLEAQAACQAEGKRLCTGSEWTLACEGRERLPYPYGYTRDDAACNIDRPHPEPDLPAFSHPRQVAAEVARLDQRVASGEMSRCESPYGVRDMTGNVDEWVVNEAHDEPVPEGKTRPYVSGLKGGYWGPVRDRCRPMTTFHNEWFRFYQVGFRCCAGAN